MALSSTKAATASSRCAISAGSVSGAASRCASSREPAGGDRAVDRGEERAAPLAAKRAHQFEIAARRLVDRQRRAGRFARRHRQRRTLADLGALDIGDRGRRRGELEARERAERGGRRHAEKRSEPPLRGGAVEHVARERGERRQRTQIRRELGVGIERVGYDDFARLDARDLGGERNAVAFGNAKFAGRYIDPGQRETVVAGRGAAARQRQQVIVALGVEQRILGQRAGRHQPHHVAAHHALGAALARFRRVFELFADRDAMAERDQPMQIFVGALDRHAAHRNVAAEMLAALGQHDAERARGDFGVVEEQFVEIAHPVEQQAIRIGRLDLDILLHHRGDAARLRRVALGVARPPSSAAVGAMRASGSAPSVVIVRAASMPGHASKKTAVTPGLAPGIHDLVPGCGGWRAPSVRR